LSYLTHTGQYFKHLHVGLLNIFDIYTLQVSQFMFKVTFNLLTHCWLYCIFSN